MFKAHGQTWSVGDILSVRTDAKFGWKVLTSAWIEERGKYYYVLAYVDAETGELDKAVSLVVRSASEINSEFQYVWDGDYIKPGSVFRDTEGAIYITAWDGRVWNTTSGTWANIKNEGGNLVWSSSKILLTEVRDVSQRSFSESLFRAN